MSLQGNFRMLNSIVDKYEQSRNGNKRIAHACYLHFIHLMITNVWIAIIYVCDGFVYYVCYTS